MIHTPPVPEASKKNPLGPTGIVAAHRVRDLRESHGWTFKELSDRLGDIGRPIPPLGLRRVEAEDRRIDADDLVALAIVLGVNPSALLLPTQMHGEIEITGAGRVPAERAWGWADGHRPLLDAEDDPDGVLLANFYDLGRPVSSVADMLVLLDTREGRRRVAARVEGLPEWSIDRTGEEITRIVRPSAKGPVTLWPLEDNPDGR